MINDHLIGDLKATILQQGSSFLIIALHLFMGRETVSLKAGTVVGAGSDEGVIVPLVSSWNEGKSEQKPGG
jgi:hypothetical protein